MQKMNSAAAILSALLLLAGCGEEDGSIKGSGSIEAAEITVSARTQGELVSVEIEEGEHIIKDTVLARIDNEDIELQLGQSRQQLRRLRANLELLREGAQKEDIRQAEAGLEQAKQTFELARISYERTRQIYESGNISPSEFDKAKTEFENARAQLESAHAQLDKLKSMPRPGEIEAMEAQVAEAELGVRRLENRIKDTVISAPRAGTVTVCAHEEGEYVTPGTPLFTIADLSRVHLTIYIQEPELARIKLRQTAAVSVDGIPDETFTGTITRIAEEAEFTPKNVQTRDARAQLVYAVEISINNTDGIFKIGMPADAELLSGDDNENDKSGS
jgi:HlyD family secretion protein